MKLISQKFVECDISAMSVDSLLAILRKDSEIEIVLKTGNQVVGVLEKEKFLLFLLGNRLQNYFLPVSTFLKNSDFIKNTLCIKMQDCVESQYGQRILSYLLQGMDAYVLVDSQNRICGLITAKSLKDGLDELLKMGFRDALTGCYNRICFQFLSEEVRNRKTAVLFIDLDNFKKINDRYGHQEGDRVLVWFAEFLRSFFRGGDHIVRYGGDEFVVLVQNVKEEDIPGIVNRLERNFLGDEIFQKFINEFDFGFSLGVSFIPPCESLEDAIKQADLSMYEVKKKRKRNKTEIKN